MSRLRSSGRGERFEQDAGNGVIPSLDREVTHGVPRHWWETRVFVAAMILLAAVPLLYPALPPLVDLPGHMARYRVELDGGQSPFLRQYYDFRWALMGNLGVDLLIWPLGKLMGLEPAVKLIVIAIPMLTVAGMLWVAREVHGRLPPTAAFALPFAYGHHFLYGFVNYALSAALALLAFALWLRLGRLGRYRLRAVLFVPIGLAVWVCHVFGWGMLGLLAFSSEAVRQHDSGRSWWKAGLRAAMHSLVLAVPLLLMLAWRENSAGATFGWFRWGDKGVWLQSALRDRWRLLDIAFMNVVLLLFVFVLANRRLTFSRMLTFTAFVMSITFLVLPWTIYGSAFADMRLAPFIVAVMLLGIRFKHDTEPKLATWLAWLAMAFLVARTVAVTASLVIASNEQKETLRALDHVARGARVLSLIGSQCGPRPWPLWRSTHLGGMTVVRREGFSNNHWRVPGARLLTVIYEPAGNYQYDPSQALRAPGCNLPQYPLITTVLGNFPRAAFDYVWIIDPPPFDQRLMGDAALVFRAQGTLLYRLRPRDVTKEAP